MKGNATAEKVHTDSPLPRLSLLPMLLEDNPIHGCVGSVEVSKFTTSPS